MTQMKTLSWTNPATAVARNENIGFEVAEITTVNITDGGSFFWCDTMTDGYYLDVDAGTITTSNGFTPLNQGAVYGASISAFTNANPGVITASNIGQVGIVAGDTIQVSAVADDGSGTTLNGTYTVASVTATTITTQTNTSAPTYSVYVSGGFVTRVSDEDGNPVATENFGAYGITLGTGVVGGNDDVMVAVVKGKMNVT